MLCNIVSHCRANTPTIYITSHVDHEKRVARIPISMHSCGSVPIHVHVVTRLHLMALWAVGTPLMEQTTNSVCV